MYINRNHFAVYQKLKQLCKSTMLHFKKKILQIFYDLNKTLDFSVLLVFILWLGELITV